MNVIIANILIHVLINLIPDVWGSGVGATTPSASEDGSVGVWSTFSWAIKITIINIKAYFNKDDKIIIKVLFAIL